MLHKTFAVIDLETTGNNRITDHILQISVVFVKDNAIVDTSTHFLSDADKIPLFVEELTRITMADLIGQPKFKDIAHDLFNKLSDCVIVAHNIHFDVTFLKDAFAKEGLDFKPKCTLDTVEMSQIVYPKIDKHQLNNVANELGIPLKNAHRADDDALATAQLLLKIIQKLSVLPKDILFQLYHESRQLRFDFDRLLLSIYETNQTNDTTKFDQVGQLYLKQLEHETVNIYKTDIKSAYEKYLAHHQLEYREIQFDIIKDVYEKLINDENIAIEAYTGAGKTSAYLIAAVVFHAETKRPVLLSTSRKILQNELFENAFRHVLDALGMYIPFISLKGKSNYINLNAVQYLIEQHSENNDYATLKMKLIIWLAESQTGDMDDLNLKATEKVYYDLATIHKPELDKYHFKRMFTAVKNHGLIITNHYYMADVLVMFPNIHHLIIDEAHQLVDALIEKHKTKLTFSSMKFMLNQVGALSDEKLLYHLYEGTEDVSYYLLEDIIEQLSIHLHNIFDAINNDQLDAAVKHINLSQPLLTRFLATIKDKPDSDILFNHVSHYQMLIDRLIEGIMDNHIHISKRNHLQQVKISLLNHHGLDYEELFQQVTSMVLLSGTLEINNKFKHIESIFRNRAYETRILTDESMFKETKLFVPNDMPKLESTDEYIEKLVEYVALYVSETNKKLVVFMTSYEAIEKAVFYLESLSELEDYAILKQTKHVSATKLLGSFKQMKHSILLVTSGFTEGVDFELDGEKVIMMQKLPFRFYDKSSSFMDEELPRAVFQFRQIIGRMNRGNSKRGIIIVFDKRILFSNYKNAFLKYFPAENIIHSSIETFKNTLTDL